jgi:hypothetical protein
MQAAVFFGAFALLEESAITLLDVAATFSLLLDTTFAALPPASSLLDSATDEQLSPDTTGVPLDSGETTEASDGLSSKQATRQSIATLVTSLKILLNITPNLLHL